MFSTCCPSLRRMWCMGSTEDSPAAVRWYEGTQKRQPALPQGLVHLKNPSDSFQTSIVPDQFRPLFAMGLMLPSPRRHHTTFVELWSWWGQQSVNALSLRPLDGVFHCRNRRIDCVPSSFSLFLPSLAFASVTEQGGFAYIPGTMPRPQTPGPCHLSLAAASATEKDTEPRPPQELPDSDHGVCHLHALSSKLI